LYELGCRLRRCFEAQVIQFCVRLTAGEEMEDENSVLPKLIAAAVRAENRWNPFACSAHTSEEFGALPARNSNWKPLYLICMTARSGSTMLCSVLERTGLVGRPDEYVNPRGPFPMFYKKSGAEDLRTYFHRVCKMYAGPGGIFGIKTPFQDLAPFIQARLFDEWFRSANMIYLSRRCIFDQAASVVIARQSGVWHQREGQDTGSQRASPQYDSLLLRVTLRNLIRERALWEGFFALYEIEPLRIGYEECASSPQGMVSVIHRVLGFLGFDLPADYPVPSPTTSKLGSELNTQWAERLRSEAMADAEMRRLLEWRDGAGSDQAR
jgi:trehalose 2-sulfotransferase